MGITPMAQELLTPPRLWASITFFDPGTGGSRGHRAPDVSIPAQAYRRLRFRRSFRRRRELDRYEQLARVIAGLSAFRSEWDIDLHVHTNATTPATAVIAELGSAWGLNLTVDQVDLRELEHPYFLAWEHKKRISSFCRMAGDQDLFLYLEDDEVLHPGSLRYFVESRKILNGNRFIPSFVRVEFSGFKKQWAFSDLFLADRRSVKVVASTSNTTFVTLGSPYCGMYILDVSLAHEMLASKWMQEATCRIPSQGIRERAAAGLIWSEPAVIGENRAAIAIERSTGRPAPACQVQHLGGVYASDPQMGYASVSHEMFHLDI